MTKQEAIETGRLYKAQLEYAINKIGLTLGEYTSSVVYGDWKINVKNEEELEMILSCFSFEEPYVDVDWEKGWRGIGFVIHFTSNIPMPFTLS